MKKEERRKVAKKYLSMISMDSFENVYPYELSGGMQQRVAIARALANNPGTIREIIEISMERPRDRGNIEYAQITARILNMLEN